MSDVRNARFLGQAVDTRALQLISETIADLEKRMAASRAAYDVIVKEEDLIKRNREVLLTQKKESYQIVCDLRVVKSRLDRINHQISNCHSEAIDLVSEERVVREKCGVNSHFELFNFLHSIILIFVMCYAGMCANVVRKTERKL